MTRLYLPHRRHRRCPSLDLVGLYQIWLPSIESDPSPHRCHRCRIERDQRGWPLWLPVLLPWLWSREREREREREDAQRERMSAALLCRIGEGGACVQWLRRDEDERGATAWERERERPQHVHRGRERDCASLPPSPLVCSSFVPMTSGSWRGVARESSQRVAPLLLHASINLLMEAVTLNRLPLLIHINGGGHFKVTVFNNGLIETVVIMQLPHLIDD